MSGKKIPYSDFKNYQVYQEVTLIALINSFSSVKISLKRRKLEREILTFFHVDEILIENEQVLEIETAVNQKCDSLKRCELNSGLSLQIAERRYHKNRIVETLHMLIDILVLYGVHFNTYVTSGKNGTIRQETIRSIELPNGVIFTTQDIKELGVKIYNEIFKKVKPTSEITITEKDLDLQNILCEMITSYNHSHEVSCLENSHLIQGNSSHDQSDQMEEMKVIKV